MKKLSLVCVLLCLFVTASFAQMTIIPKAGISYATVSSTDDMLDGADKPKSKIGAVIGAALEIGISENIAVQPELLYHQKGAKDEYEEDGYSSSSTYTLNYFEVPILLKAKFGNFYAVVGPSVGFGIGGKEKWEWEGFGYSDSGESDIKFGDEPDGYQGEDLYLDNGTDFGVQAGLGAKLGPVVVEIRYGHGLTDINDKPSGFPGDWSNKNRSLQFTVGFPIPIGN